DRIGGKYAGEFPLLRMRSDGLLQQSLMQIREFAARSIDHNGADRYLRKIVRDFGGGVHEQFIIPSVPIAVGENMAGSKHDVVEPHVIQFGHSRNEGSFAVSFRGDKDRGPREFAMVVEEGGGLSEAGWLFRR